MYDQRAIHSTHLQQVGWEGVWQSWGLYTESAMRVGRARIKINKLIEEVCKRAQPWLASLKRIWGGGVELTFLPHFFATWPMLAPLLTHPFQIWAFPIFVQTLSVFPSSPHHVWLKTIYPFKSLPKHFRGDSLRTVCLFWFLLPLQDPMARSTTWQPVW